MDRATQKLHQHRWAVITLAPGRAKKAVVEALRLKPQHFSAREIAFLAGDYLTQHRARLIAEGYAVSHSTISRLGA